MMLHNYCWSAGENLVLGWGLFHLQERCMLICSKFCFHSKELQASSILLFSIWHTTEAANFFRYFPPRNQGIWSLMFAVAQPDSLKCILFVLWRCNTIGSLIKYLSESLATLRKCQRSCLRLHIRHGQANVMVCLTKTLNARTICLGKN